MARIKQAVIDAGPFIHLNEIGQLGLLKLFGKVLTTKQIVEETHIADRLKKTRRITQKELTSGSKDLVKYLVEKYDIDLGEATGIALCKQENVALFFTDDLDARDAARRLGFEPHGTLAIVTRAYREKIITKSRVLKVVNDLHDKSTLFFTKDLRDWAVREIGK